jgi:hypothetical protein
MKLGKVFALCVLLLSALGTRCFAQAFFIDRFVSPGIWVAVPSNQFQFIPGNPDAGALHLPSCVRRSRGRAGPWHGW